MSYLTLGTRNKKRIRRKTVGLITTTYGIRKRLRCRVAACQSVDRVPRVPNARHSQKSIERRNKNKPVTFARKQRIRTHIGYETEASETFALVILFCVTSLSIQQSVTSLCKHWMLEHPNSGLSVSIIYIIYCVNKENGNIDKLYNQGQII